MRPIHRNERPVIETVEQIVLSAQVDWQPSNMEGRLVFTLAERVLVDGNAVRVENTQRVAIALDKLRTRVFTISVNGTPTPVGGDWIEQSWAAILGAVAEEARVAAANAAAERERIQREQDEAIAGVQALQERHQREAQDLEASMRDKPQLGG